MFRLIAYIRHRLWMRSASRRMAYELTHFDANGRPKQRLPFAAVPNNERASTIAELEPMFAAPDKVAGPYKADMEYIAYMGGLFKATAEKAALAAAKARQASDPRLH